MRDFLEYQDGKQYAKLVKEAQAEAEELGIDYVAPDKLAPSDFSVPDGVDPFWVDKTTGFRAEPNSQNAIYEYFLSGTEPMRAAQEEDSVSYLDSPEL
jgi:membrane carboxypeptidase/penicillin-binding protein